MYSYGISDAFVLLKMNFKYIARKVSYKTQENLHFIAIILVHVGKFSNIKIDQIIKKII